MPAETAIPKRKSSSRTRVKSSPSAVAGISRSMVAGTHFSKQWMDFDTDLFAEVYRAYTNQEITVHTTGERLGCSARTFRRRYTDAYPANSDDRKMESNT